MAKRDTTCPQCNGVFQAEIGLINRALSQNAPLYCSRTCSGLARRKPDKLTGDAFKIAKAEYDRQRRAKLGEELREKKRNAYYAAIERDEALVRQKQKAYRKKIMPRHVEYCRQPEYKAKKRQYDRQLRAQAYGPFADAYLLLQDIQGEISTCATRQEIYEQNGTINKTQKRKREYEKAVGC